MSYRILSQGGALAGTLRTSANLHVAELLESLHRDRADDAVAIVPVFDVISGELIEFSLIVHPEAQKIAPELFTPAPAPIVAVGPEERARALELAIASIGEGDIVIHGNDANTMIGPDVFERADAFLTYITQETTR